MCDPVAGPMAALMVIQAYQSQESAMASAQATNDAFSANQALQNEAYTKDMEAFWGEEIAIQSKPIRMQRMPLMLRLQCLSRVKKLVHH